MVDRVRTVGRVLASGRPPLFEVDGVAAAMLTETEVYTAVELLLPLAARCEDLETFLQALSTGAEVDALDPRAQAVTLLTLHAAKGLEWPVVFIVGCEDGLLPLRFPGTEPDAEAVAEERRLFFVGLTRAQRRLFLSHAARRTRHGAEVQPARTPFLDAGRSGSVAASGRGTARRPPAPPPAPPALRQDHGVRVDRASTETTRITPSTTVPAASRTRPLSASPSTTAPRISAITGFTYA